MSLGSDMMSLNWVSDLMSLGPIRPYLLICHWDPLTHWTIPSNLISLGHMMPLTTPINLMSLGHMVSSDHTCNIVSLSLVMC